MSLTLAIDTATRRTGIALASSQNVIGELYEEGATAHGEALSRLASQLLQGVDRATISSVAVGVGPGPLLGYEWVFLLHRALHSLSECQ